MLFQLSSIVIIITAVWWASCFEAGTRLSYEFIGSTYYSPTEIVERPDRSRAAVERKEMFHVPLGGYCNATENCAASYSICLDNMCTCQSGFLQVDFQACDPKGFYCPDVEGKEPKRISSPKKCVDEFSPSPKLHCLEGEYCFIHPTEKDLQHADVGHCCPKVVNKVVKNFSACPLANITEKSKNRCKIDEMQIDFSVGISDLSYAYQAQCCPLACQPNEYEVFSFNGKCYAYSRLGEECEINSQCTYSHTFCNATTSQCECRHGYQPTHYGCNPESAFT